MAIQTFDFQGQPALQLRTAHGDTATVALHGAQVLSWQTADGIERLYLSPLAAFDGRTAIRGGVPVCFPQFNQRGPLPKHGFARNLAWQAQPAADDASLTLSLRDSDATRLVWPQAFRVDLTVTLAPRALTVALAVNNTGAQPWSFAAALHTYLRVDELANARLEGLQGANRWDAVRDDRHVETASALAFTSEFDSVYAAPAKPLRLVQPTGAMEISQSASCTETVVWNPGALLCEKLSDMPPDGWRHMLCVEAARIDEPVVLQSGAQWRGWQQLRVA